METSKRQQKEAAKRIAQEALRMQRLAEREGYGFLVYLLAMTHVEALETLDRLSEPSTD